MRSNRSRCTMLLVGAALGWSCSNDDTFVCNVDRRPIRHDVEDVFGDTSATRLPEQFVETSTYAGLYVLPERSVEVSLGVSVDERRPVEIVETGEKFRSPDCMILEVVTPIVLSFATSDGQWVFDLPTEMTSSGSGVFAIRDFIDIDELDPLHRLPRRTADGGQIHQAYISASAEGGEFGGRNALVVRTELSSGYGFKVPQDMVWGRLSSM